MNGKIITGGILVVVLLAIGWWAVRGDRERESGPIRIGASLPLTGEAASLGEQMKAGLDVALKEINDAGGLGGRLVEIVYEDDKCSNAGASTFNKLISIDNVVAIIGPLCSAAAGPAVPIAEQSNVPTLLWASAPALTAGEYIFRTYPSDSFQGKFSAEYIFNVLGKKKVAVLYVKNDWGQGLTDVFVERFGELGGAVSLSEGMDQNSTDVRTTLLKIKATAPEALFAPLYPAGGTAAVKQMKQLGLSIPVIGGDAYGAEEFVSTPEAAGTLFTEGKFPEQSAAFKEKIKSITGFESGVFTPLAYDTLKVLARVIERVGTNSQDIKEGLTQVSFTGGLSSPLIEFDQRGDLKQAEFTVKIVEGGKGIPYVR